MPLNKDISVSNVVAVAGLLITIGTCYAAVLTKIGQTDTKLEMIQADRQDKWIQLRTELKEIRDDQKDIRDMQYNILKQVQK